MSLDSSKYDLEIVSLEPGHEGKTFKQYSINSEKTIGVFENEPFKICFKNKTSKKVQVRVAIDGTDILTGEEASTTTDGRMWIVNPYGVLELKAWPETNQGGSSFLFGKSKNSVAANTHGNMSATGIIAVAVFEEAYEPPQFNYTKTHHWFGKTPIGGGWSSSGGTYGSNIRRSMTFDSADSDSLSLGENVDYCCSIETNVETKAAVGAGEYVNQQIKTATGLIKPKLGPVVQLKYEWWTSLKSKIREQHKEPTATFQGFPGDVKPFINLDNVPKIEKRQIKKRKYFQNRQKYVEFQRFV